MASVGIQLKRAIIKKYGSVNKWIEEHDISSVRFYAFLNNKHDVRLKTLKKWLRTVDSELAVKSSEKRRSAK